METVNKLISKNIQYGYMVSTYKTSDLFLKIANLLKNLITDCTFIVQ